MSNWTCPKCSEQWDLFGLKHGDVNKYEADAMFKGLGCPSCSFEQDAIPDCVELFTCSACLRTIKASPEEFIYNGDEVVRKNPDEETLRDFYDERFEHVCYSCFQKREQCDYCKQYYYEDGDTHFIQHSHTVVCIECLEDGKVCECGACHLDYDTDYMNKTPDGQLVCETCLEELVVECTKCHTPIMANDDDTEWDDNANPYCSNCHAPEEDNG